MSSARRQVTLSAGTSITLVKITNDFYYYNTKKDLDGHLAKNGAKFKKLCNTYNKMQNQMEAPKKQNKMLFKLSKKRNLRELNTMNNTNKSIYDSSRSNGSSISSD